MYKCKSEIENKLKQVKYLYIEISKFKNRIFVKNGLDEETGSYPLLTHIGSFLVHTRSILQYSYKEAKESGNQNKYEKYVNQSNVFKFFKEIRDNEIHEYTINSCTTINGYSPIISFNPKTQVAIGKMVNIYIEKLSDLNSPKCKNQEVEVVISLSKKIKSDNSLIKRLESEGRMDLVAAIKNGKDLYEELELNGEKDIFKLCELYIKEIELFIRYGIINGFIT